MKKNRFIFCAIMLLFTLAASIYAQQLKTMYFMSEWSQRHQFNPAFAPSQGYVGLAFSNIGIQGSSSLSVDKVLFPKNGELVTFMHPSVSPNEFLSGIQKQNTLYENLHYNVFSAGWFTSQNSFWTFGLDIDQNLDLSIPYDLFAFAKNGMSTSSTSYSLKDFGVSSQAIASTYLGYSREIIKDLRVGAKVKAKLGLGGASVRYDRMDVVLTDDKWAISSQGTMSIFAKDANSLVDNEGNLNITDIDPLNLLQINGYGFSVDLGATYKPLPRLTVAASITDLGRIYWNKGSIQQGDAFGEFEFEGFKEVDPGNFDVDDQIDQLESDLEKLYTFQHNPNPKSLSSATRANLNLSAEYSFLDYVPACDLRFGLLWDTRFSEVGTFHELTAVATVQPTDWFTFSLSAGMIQKKFKSIGSALNFSTNGFNFFLATDFIPFNYTPQFIPIGPMNLTAQVGINWAFGRNVKKQPAALSASY